MSRYNRNQQQSKSTITTGQTNGSQLQHTWINIPSSNNGSWNSVTLIDCKEVGIVIHEAIIVYNLGPVTGMVGTSTTAPRFLSSYYFSQRSEIVFGNNSIDNLYSTQNFLNNQLWYNDDDRAFMNSGAGNYASISNRYTLANTSSIFYCPLFCCFNQLNISPLSANHNFQLRLNLDSLSNLVEKGTLTGTPACTINSISLMLRVSKLDQPSILNRINNLKFEGPGMATFNSTIFQPINVPAGILTLSTTLTAFSMCDLQHLYFVIRPNGSTGDALMQFLPLVSNYYLMSGSGENITSGSPVNAAFALNTLNRHSTKGSYCSETSLGLVNNYANVYAWYFNLNATATSNDGVARGSRKMLGTESLVINFNVTTAMSYYIEVYGSATSIFEQSTDACKKLSLNA